MAEQSTSAADPSDNVKVVMEVTNLMAQGKRNMVCGEIPDAVNQLQQACRLLSKQFGETADECAEAYFCYGKALLEISRMESGVLGNGLQGTLDEDEEKSSSDADDKKASSDDRIEKDNLTAEEKEKISEEVIDAMLETDEEQKTREEKAKAGDDSATDKSSKTEEAAKPDEKGDVTAVESETKTEETKEKSEEKPDAAAKDENPDKTTVEKKDEAMETEEKSEGETSQEEAESEDNGEEGEDGEGEEEDEEESEGSKDEEDVSNLQLAWEMLELAKMIYKRHSKKEMQLRLADAHLKLGEVGLETEQYDQAVADFKECLKIQKEHLEPEDRCIAETHYQLGLACTYQGSYDDAVNQYKFAASTIEAKIAKLNEVIETGEKEGKGKETASFDDPVVVAQKELKDLQEILPDIMSKVEDVLDEQRSSDQVKKLVKDNLAGDLGDTTTGFGTSADSAATESKAQDITHLVRKKRKPEPEAEDTTEETTKKAKTETTEVTKPDDAKDDVKDTTEKMEAQTKETEETPAESAPVKTPVKTVVKDASSTEETKELTNGHANGTTEKTPVEAS